MTAMGLVICVVGALALVAALVLAVAGKTAPEPQRVQWTAAAIHWWVTASIFFSLGVGVCGFGRAVRTAAAGTRQLA